MAISDRFPPNEKANLPLPEAGKRRAKRIGAHTDAELDEAIGGAILKFGHDEFYAMLHGIDAYMERRKRRAALRTARMQREALDDIYSEDIWGNS